MPRLIIFDDQVRAVDLPSAPVIIGRSQRSDIPIRDDILSRKHCALLPLESGCRLVDLKSANGTYLNGRRVDKVGLSYDDIIEIGNTVMVFLDTNAWSRGEGLTRLRNPLKAQELIQRIRLQDKEKKRIPVRRVLRKRPTLKRGRDLVRSLPVLEHLGSKKGGNGVSEEVLLDLLVDYSVYKTVSMLVRNDPELRRVVAESVETALIETLSGNWQDLRSRLRKDLQGKLDASSPGGREKAPKGQRGREEPTQKNDAGSDNNSSPADL